MTDMVHIFDPDEMTMQKVEPHWTKANLLNQQGLFWLKDVVALLEIDPHHVTHRHKSLRKNGAEPYKTIGVRKLWKHYVVRMGVFADFYRTELKPPHEHIPPRASKSRLLKSKSTYLMAEAADVLGLTPYQIRYRAGKVKDAKHVMGVWKEDRQYVINMAVFGPWYRNNPRIFSRKLKQYTRGTAA